MTGLVVEGGSGGLLEELRAFNTKLRGVPFLRRGGLLCLKACAWGGYRYGRWQWTRSSAAKRVEEACGAVRCERRGVLEGFGGGRERAIVDETQPTAVDEGKRIEIRSYSHCPLRAPRFAVSPLGLAPPSAHAPSEDEA